jgi:hypothetical protein
MPELEAVATAGTVTLPSLGEIHRDEYLRLNARGFARLYRRALPGLPRRLAKAWGERIVRERERGHTPDS